MIIAALFVLFAGTVPGAPYPVPNIHGGTGHWAPCAGHSHDTHVSLTRVVFEGNTIALRVRLFHDDLTHALRQHAGRADLKITPDARADSLFGAYFAQVVKLRVNDRPVALRVTSSGTEKDEAAQQVVWYVLEGGLDHPAFRLVLLNALLFESFGDQQNIVQLLHLPDDTRRSLYFTASDPREQVVEFRRK